MKITGFKRWIILAAISLMSGLFVFVPYLRFNYYSQMVTVFTEYKSVVSPDIVNGFIGDIALAYGIVALPMYILGGIFADKFKEKNLLTLGGIGMGLVTFWYASIPDSFSLLIVHVLYALIGTGFIWSAYLKLVRKLGTTNEQGRMYSVSEFIRAIIGTALGFLGASFLGQALLHGETDPQIMGEQFSLFLIICGGVFIALAVLVFFIIPKNVVGLEVEDENVPQAKFTVQAAVSVLKMPGVWMIAILVFFCYSFTAAGSGYITAYTTDVMGVSSVDASFFATIRNYIIAALSTLAIGFVADKIGSKVKTLGFYLAIASALTLVLIMTKNFAMISIAITFVFAFVYTGMRGIYFATLSEVKVPLALTGIATGVISLICYLPDVYFAKLAGFWLDMYGTQGYDFIWFWAIACGVLGVIMAFITYRYAKKLDGGQPAIIEE